MKKNQLIAIVIAVAIFLACGILAVSTYRQSLQGSEKLQYLSMKIDAGECAFDLVEANRCTLEALYAIHDIAKYEEYNNQAISLLRDAEEEMKQVIPSPNFFDDEIRELQKMYQRAGEVIKKGSNKSEEEWQEFLAIEEEAAYKHLYLIRYSAAFTSLYSIREYDGLPDQEAKDKLKEFWWQFMFDESIEYPETIDAGELYIIWARQYFEKELDQSMIEQINLLRANDKIASKEYNAKWMELIEELCGTGLIFSPFFYSKNIWERYCVQNYKTAPNTSSPKLSL